MRSSRANNDQTNARRVCSTLLTALWIAALLIGAASTATAAPETAKGVAGSAASSEAPLPGLADVVDDLRRGGLVIYFRHAATEQAGASDETADLDNCQTQRNLSAQGRAQAAQIGQAFRTLGISVSSVTTSPFCRCKETGELAFGRFVVSNDLYFAINADAERTKGLAEALRRTLATPPQPGTNAVIVSHSANLREAVGVWPKPEGAAYVFRPLASGRFELIARVLPDDWIGAAKRK